MTAQPSLFDPPPRLSHRRTDPVTSKRAARQLPVRERQAEVLAALRWLAVASDPAAIRDRLAQSGMHRERGEVASRLAELLELGLVRKVGVKQGPRGRAVTTWALTAEGDRIARETA